MLIGALMGIHGLSKMGADPQLALLQSPDKVREMILAAADSLKANSLRRNEETEPIAKSTSWGLLLIAERISHEKRSQIQYSVSLQGKWMSLEMASQLAEAFRQIRHRDAIPKVIEGKEGVFHLRFEKS